MVSVRVLVLDASVGVKWFREEPGSPEARDILREHGDGTVRVVVPTLFVHELLDVARRTVGFDATRRIWHALAADEILVVGDDAELVEHTIDMAQQLGCTIYAAAAPALAARLGCTLVSADRRAHEAVPGVLLLG